MRKLPLGVAVSTALHAAAVVWVSARPDAPAARPGDRADRGNPARPAEPGIDDASATRPALTSALPGSDRRSRRQRRRGLPRRDRTDAKPVAHDA
ncbi:MAG TPA: hypothetical protein VFD36_22510, partial [Kofleriaceae bacterium]|nr:hypothetical protein [Kofleriaceae bacterium]